MPAPTGAGPAMPAAPTAQASLTGARRTPLKRVSRSFFALVLLALVANIGFLWAIAQAFSADRQARQRHEVTLAFVDDLRHESDRLGRLVRAYVSTANARYLRVYYDILAVRTGEKAAPLADDVDRYWENVIAGRAADALPAQGPGVPLAERARRLDFDAEGQAAVQRLLEAAERLHKTEQVAFAATQGLYDADEARFVDEGKPDLAYAHQLVFGSAYERDSAA